MTEEAKEPLKKKRGAQAGNQNARTHGFYAKVFTPEQQEQLDTAVEITDLDQEIALMRIKILSILTRDPDNHTVLFEAINTLKKMITANEDFKWLSRIHKPRVITMPKDPMYDTVDSYLSGTGGR